MDAGLNRYYIVRDGDGELFQSATESEARAHFNQIDRDEIVGDLEFLAVLDVKRGS